MAMEPRGADDRGDAPPLAHETDTGSCPVTGTVTESPQPQQETARRVVCTRLRGRQPLAFLGRDQTVVGYIPYLPRPGRTLRVYSPNGVCVLQSSRIRLLTHGPDSTLLVTKNSTYRVTFVDDV